MKFDICIAGAGVIGLAIAQELATQKKTVLLLERNSSFGQEVSSRNSEVIHAGIYYPEDALKTTLCIEGRRRLYSFCEQYRVPYRKLGKLIVCSDSQDIAQLESIYHNAVNNGVEEVHLVDSDYCKKHEPAIKACMAISSPQTGIIDSHSYMLTLLGLAQNQGVDYVANTLVERVACTENGLNVHCKDRLSAETMTISCGIFINAAGLNAVELAKNIEGIDPLSLPQYYYAKGHYFRLQGKSPFSHLIYPLTEKKIQGLGVHATLDLAGQVKFGPDVEYIQQVDYQFNSLAEARFKKAIAAYYPEIEQRTISSDYVGVRPKLQGPNDSFKDFYIERTDAVINLFGIESPGLTASLEIAKYVRNLIG
ncbi:NAD(P)/FAD-dependent oxidoreductase [Aliikangiella sp. G2MR2-5]|uniref:NAD(P)/FAD-dependent oxidoreductase n=1 Tax=Aliikangiella sp. G2MR2-5 TaxID=2788943 RepID=UPI0018A8FD1E|nr:NAD(P)/FAD-dependent oxidoreductase [Aliikangiella sp. G2MR2-5]